MPFGSVEDVRQKTLEMLKISKECGKLVIAPTHLLEPEVPLENIEMFVNTVKEFNKFM
jgi:uroporphyrinogen decarboxylase